MMREAIIDLESRSCKKAAFTKDIRRPLGDGIGIGINGKLGSTGNITMTA